MTNSTQERISEIQQSLENKASLLTQIQTKIETAQDKSSLWNLNSRAQNIKMDMDILSTELKCVFGISFDEPGRKMQ